LIEVKSYRFQARFTLQLFQET